MARENRVARKHCVYTLQRQAIAIGAHKIMPQVFVCRTCAAPAEQSRCFCYTHCEAPLADVQVCRDRLGFPLADPHVAAAGAALAALCLIGRERVSAAACEVAHQGVEEVHLPHCCSRSRSK